MKIYQSEILDNLQEAIASKVTARCEFGLAPKPSKIAASVNLNQPDLFYIDDCVLVSTNWNANDDVFTKAEVWQARSTPKDKQFNHMHDDGFIIGHITGCKVVDFNGSVVAEDTSLDQLPDFDISISSVLYTRFSDKEKADIVQQIIREIPDNKWCVSMECLFSDFDYAVLMPDGEQRVLSRNEDSAFLTKHLRVYGGTGKFKEYQIGRILKNITFCGVGSVDKPANPRSQIRSFSFNGALASIQDFSEKKMSKEIEGAVATLTQEPMVLKAQYDELKKELAEAKSIASEASKKEMEDAKKEKASLESLLAAAQTELASANTLSADKTAKIAALEVELTAAQEQLKVLSAEKDKMEEEKKAQCRINQLIGVGVDAVKASELVAKFAAASDEMFTEVVALNTKAAENPFKKDEDEKKDKKAECAKIPDIDLVVAETKTVPQSNEDQSVAKSTASYFGSILKNKKGE
jgi:hypothetical protein